MSSGLGTMFVSVSELVDTIQQELQARAATLDELAAEAEAARLRAESARARAAISEDSAEAVDALLELRAAELETANHRWEVKVLLAGLLLRIPPGVVAALLATKFGG
jgi:hypothetical protein